MKAVAEAAKRKWPRENIENLPTFHKENKTMTKELDEFANALTATYSFSTSGFTFGYNDIHVCQHILDTTKDRWRTLRKRIKVFGIYFYKLLELKFSNSLQK